MSESGQNSDYYKTKTRLREKHIGLALTAPQISS